ncbi:DUF397 domain-containing protein [Nocardia sp. BSTN01]|uniref:DUF397 domain-containing protein n=1 Tax=Nocardia sp. BSTN01 TaxID=2783665 RepID=UPI00188F2F49|nr:DUF397 domain-containing protein [Nocardia sp. BSTN01]MBF4999770.1 DUF397 domain-containing protein [Nocardia sp. BSTN01]
MSTNWFKSTFSGGEKTCVEVAHTSASVLLRDSKYVGPEQDQPIITVARDQWQALLDLVLTNISGHLADNLILQVQADGSALLARDGIELAYNADEWDAFVKGVADGQFDRP